MNTPAGHRDDDLRYAEYVLGVLDVDARELLQREIRDNPQAATAVALWQSRLMPLADDLDEVPPAPYVWARIHDALQLAAPVTPRPRDGLWNSLRLWRWLGIGASALATACVVIMLVQLRAPTAPAAIRTSYMAATIEQDNGTAGWTATMDLQRARMIVVPATPVAFAPGHAPELWLIPPGGKPLSLGVIERGRPTSIALRPELLAHFAANTVLAVSVEPLGGSATGQPTGAVIAKGAIGGA
jgi:anti-sigma-K factor RskA